MRCLACDKILNDLEATRRNETTNEFVDLCTSCLSQISADINYTERYDLSDENSELLEESLQGDLFDNLSGSS